MDTALLTKIENLRRATLAELREKYREVFQEETRSRHREHLFRRIAWRLQALAEGDLPERARRRAQQIAQDADLRMIAPRDFLVVGGERVRTTPSNRSRRQQDTRLPLPGTLLKGSGEGGPCWSKFSRRASAMNINITPRSVRLRWPSPAHAGTASPFSG